MEPKLRVKMESKENNNINKSHCGGKCPRGKLFATNWLDGISSSGDYDVVQVVFKNTRSGFYANPSRLDLKIGDMVAVEGSPGHDVGRVSMIGRLVRLQMKKGKVTDETGLKVVFRHATEADLEKAEEAASREVDTMIRSRQIAKDLDLDMKIGDVEYQGDGGKAIFYYIADERVDFRKLIRVLADTFKVRIEMKQIGARQEAGRIGGIGPCGRPLCCSSWMSHFVSVGTGAARIQDLSMNPQKLAGQCAKLKCCLNFEIDSYAEACKQLPGKDVTLETKDGTYYYFKPDILARKVTYSTDRNIPANLVTIDASRAFEIIALNKQGIKVDSLIESTDSDMPQREYMDLAEQDSLTRFDNSKRKKRKGGNKSQNQGNRNPQQKIQNDLGKPQEPKNQNDSPKGRDAKNQNDSGRGNNQPRPNNQHNRRNRGNQHRENPGSDNAGKEIVKGKGQRQEQGQHNHRKNQKRFHSNESKEGV